MEATSSHHPSLLLLLSLLVLPGALAAGVTSTFGKGRNITDGDFRVSDGGKFTLGFFSPGASTKRYLGIWFTVASDTVCWVANGERPLLDKSGVLAVSETGSLVLLDGSGRVAWSSNSTITSSAEAELLDTGNLVVRGQGSTTILWQSFDHPSNTMLPGMKVGKSTWTGAEWYLTSWRSADDPSPGAYRRVLDTSGLPDFVVRRGNVTTYRTGPWNGRWFSGIPEVSTYGDLVTFEVSTSTLGETSYGYAAKPGAPPTAVVLTDTGVAKRLVWDASSRKWQTFFQGPTDVCDDYGKCGAFSMCDAGAAPPLFCSCLQGFSAATPLSGDLRDTSGGCRRNVPLSCVDGEQNTTDAFLLVQSVKLPVTHNASVDMSITVEDCRVRCLANCSCMAYAAADIREGGSGCIMWTDIIDLRYVDQGSDLYLKLAASEFGMFPVVAVIAPVASVVAMVVLLFVMIWWRRKQRRKQKLTGTVDLSDLRTIKGATGDFSESSVIGRGGFAVVYKGELADGRKIAVKRFKQSALTNKGRSDFTREVDVMARLRHGNLLHLLACCNEGDECILIYNYMPNKSLDLYIFGESNLRAALNWRQRLDIIDGIAQGVAYLHHGLGESVIHRDLKPANVLLDDKWKPKIADFNTAKLFDADKPETNPTIVVSPGYASPEYAWQGEITLKCDVYSFGITLLETLSGHRNGATQRLLSHAWELWEQGRAIDLLDPSVPDSGTISELERCIKIGLLCVQEAPHERPAMPAVVAMLTSKSSHIDPPNRPALHGRPPLQEVDLGSPSTTDLT